MTEETTEEKYKDLREFINEYSALVTMVQENATLRALELSNEQMGMIHAIYRKDHRTPQSSGGSFGGGYKGGGNSGPGNYPTWKDINFEGVDQSQFDAVVPFLEAVGFTLDDSKGFPIYKAKDSRGVNVSALYSKNKKVWYYTEWNRDTKAHDFIDKGKCDKIDKLKILVDVITGREMLNAVCDDIKNEPPQDTDGGLTETPLENEEE